MNLIFTCGGTAGHINPAIAVANMMKERHPQCNILFIGAQGHMEEKLVPQAGYEVRCLPGSGLSRKKNLQGMKERHPQCNILFIGAQGHMEEKLVPQAGYEVRCLPGSGLSRKKNLQGVKQNIRAVKCVLDAVKACKAIFRDFQPDVVIGTGGYASFPALYAAQSMGIPTCVHESNAVPGVTTKMAANRASRVLVAFAESVQYYKHPEKVEVVGMPVRREFLYETRQQARQQLREFLYETRQQARQQLDLHGPVVVSAFGSQGAKVMNETIADMLPLEQADGFPFHHIHATGSFGKEWMPKRVEDNGVDWKKVMNETIADMLPLEQADGFPFHHIHATGSFGKEWMPKRVEDNGVDWKNCPQLDIREYIYNMPEVMAAADLVIGRAGSATCNELAAAGIPCVLIPSPNVTNNHQEKNARLLESGGGAVVMLEKDCTPQALYDQIRQLLSDDQRRGQMARNLHAMARLDSTERICDIVESLCKA